ncbi:hypothetical protein MJO28_015850 [Puccinia striiformis f. sp. tritici]|uniref:Uncharacterized protein n=4 Tax=Puccinia striiformis TaxID=27350 RepID=A0A2S4WH21_9BASI|nr:hypothetical protein MJO29_015555 [Puccinia striiformis f. sp. tritici]KAI7936951.1 hypothetical protein MJO28_015850 [Puccinia striiformis f. sp. tritici]POW21090.1 hypothetical protein PSHT_02838 [Puccinia striiformis]
MLSRLILASCLLSSAHGAGFLDQSIQVERGRDKLNCLTVLLKPSSLLSTTHLCQKNIINISVPIFLHDDTRFHKHPESPSSKSLPLPNFVKYVTRSFNKSKPRHSSTVADASDLEPELRDVVDLATHDYKKNRQSWNLDPARQQAIAFQRLIEALDEQRPLNTALVTKLKKNWAKNNDKVMSLYDNWMWLLSFKEMIKVEYEWLSWTTSSAREEIWEAHDIIQDNHSKILTLMQFRLLKLGGLDSNALYWNRIKLSFQDLRLPGDRLGLAVEKQLETVGASILDGVKKLTRYDLQTKLLHWHRSLILLLPWRYAFRVVDLLSENGFIGEEKLKSFLREEGMAELVIRYSNALFEHKSFYAGFTGDKPWKRLNRSFEALDAETRSSIERSFLENRETQTGIKQLSKTKEPSEEIVGIIDDEVRGKIQAFVEEKMHREYKLDRPAGKPGFFDSPSSKAILRDRILWRLEKEFVEKLKLEQDFESSRRLTSSQRLKAHFDKLKYYAPDHKDGFLSSNSVEEAFKKEKEALEKEMAHERGTVY